MDSKVLLIESSGLSFSVGDIPVSVSEAAFKTGLMMLKGVPATVLDVKNGNGRTYSEKEIRKSLSKLKKENAFANRRMHCSADDHPKDSYVQPIKASHIVTDAYIKKGEDGKSYLMNDWLILNTSNGKNLKALVQAKASIGTSIRGLGQLNEDTKHVENYDYLGTDAVGNPSAQTFASPGQMQVAVESLDPDEAEEITEQLESGDMFDLIESIKIFKSKHFKDDKPVNPGARPITEDLLNIQREAVQVGVKDLSPLDTLTDQIYGTTLADKINNVPNTPSPNNYASDKDKDALNKALRELEATKNLATHYQSIAEDLETQKKEYDCKIAAFEDVSTTIYEQLQEATEKLNDGSTTKEARTITERALRTVRQIQREARTLIKGLEITLENAIRVGDQYAENAIVLRRIVDTLYSQFLEASDKNNYVSSKGMAVKVDERMRGNGSARQAITEGMDKRHGPSVSHSGNRAGWV
jgi:conjugal transfer/entry exclusion protein